MTGEGREGHRGNKALGSKRRGFSSRLCHHMIEVTLSLWLSLPQQNKTIITSKLPFSSDFLWLEIDKIVPSGHTVLDAWGKTLKDFLQGGIQMYANGQSRSHILLYNHPYILFEALLCAHYFAHPGGAVVTRADS